MFMKTFFWSASHLASGESWYNFCAFPLEKNYVAETQLFFMNLSVSVDCQLKEK